MMQVQFVMRLLCLCGMSVLPPAYMGSTRNGRSRMSRFAGMVSRTA